MSMTKLTWVSGACLCLAIRLAHAQDYLLEDLDRIEGISGPGAGDTQGLYLEGGGGTQLRDSIGPRYAAARSANVAFYAMLAFRR